jgi:hypothetical protein
MARFDARDADSIGKALATRPGANLEDDQRQAPAILLGFFEK